ncbi:SGS domain-containing protein [Xylariaceae sp. FL0662B]|nr:SGS domain-containing protein [Xylariaceae sp. FL0662B]
MSSPLVLADQGLKAIKAGQYAVGIAKLTEALKERPAPLWLLERSKAYLRTGKLDHALYDAEKALRVALERANREQMMEAQLRRAITLFRLGRFADADICAYWTIRLHGGYRATEDDGQQNKVDSNGEYTVTASEVTASEAETQNGAKSSASLDEMLAAMKGSTQTYGSSIRNQASTWRLQALTQLQKLPAGHPGRKVNISEKYPNPTPPSQASPIENVDDIDDGKVNEVNEDNAGNRDSWEGIWEKYIVLHTKNDIRTDYYQSDKTLNVDFFVKNVPKEGFNVEADTRSVTLGPIPTTSNGSIKLFLHGNIKPSETKYTVKSMKIELVLRKETPGKWMTLQRQNANLVDNIRIGTAPQASFNQFLDFVKASGYKDPEDLHLPDYNESQGAWYRDLLGKLQAGLDVVQTSTPTAKATSETLAKTTHTTLSTKAEDSADQPKLATESTSPVSKTGPVKTTDGVPAYPTSSKKGPMNWDKFAEGDNDDDANDGDVESFFRKIYKDADDDTKRAMMKSYIESNGTSLSTSWAEAGSKTYETNPPDGAEAVHWDK